MGTCSQVRPKSEPCVTPSTPSVSQWGIKGMALACQGHRGHGGDARVTEGMGGDLVS